MNFISTASRVKKEDNVMQSLYLSPEQNRFLVAKIGVNAVYVFTHYIAITFQRNPNMEDAQLSKLTGLSIQVIKRTRLALTKIGWFKKIKDNYKGQTKFTYLVGESAVSQINNAVLNTSTHKKKQPPLLIT